MNVSTATEADLHSILSLINAAFQVERFFKNQDRLTAEDLQAHFKNRSISAQRRRRAGSPAAFTSNVMEQCAYFGLLSVDPSRQKAGIGRRLVAAAEEFARETGAHYMDLRIIHLRTELLEIYGKMGYQITGTEPYPDERNHMLTQPVHFITMTKELGHRE